jgi:hypothetical protein
MGDAVADRTINRRIFTEEQKAALPEPLVLNPEDPLFKEWKNAADLSEHAVRLDNEAPFVTKEPELRIEKWRDVAERVAHGNASLHQSGMKDEGNLRDHLMRGTVLLSGRHLQHGDANQKNRPMEVLTNCATSASTFILFYLLLNGSGVGRAYDDSMMKVDWTRLPHVKVVIDGNYPDRGIMEPHWNGVEMGERPKVPHVMTPQDARAGYSEDMDRVTWFEVPDSRGGWAQALEIMENMAYEGRTDEVLVLDFSKVRPYGSPIRGMQNRPSSGPGPLMYAIMEIAKLRGRDMAPWKAAMFADHYAAECVLVGGARRAARMATKNWRDPDILEFIRLKWTHDLWSSNNSVTIDDEFRERCNKVRDLIKYRTTPVSRDDPDALITIAKMMRLSNEIDHIDLHAWTVLINIADSAFQGPHGEPGRGEPGIINQDRLKVDDSGIEAYIDGLYARSLDFQVSERSMPMMRDMAREMLSVRYTMITNPCGEIALLMLGGYCVIADNVPFHARDDDDAESAFRASVRALMRVNTMDSLYNREVARTNRIGVGITGFHEWAYDRFGFTWHDLIDEEKSKKLWLTLSRFRRAISDEARKYAEVLGVTVPHTDTTFKPAGTTSKLFGLSEGAHLPSMRWLLRWVQFRNDDPLVQEYIAKGYPSKQLKSYSGTTVIGFPTAPAITRLGGGEWVVTAAEATPAEQYEFLRLLEKYWIRGVDENGEPLAEDRGNQISYTLKYDPAKVTFGDYLETLMSGQFSIRCCSIMPQTDTTGYEYQPEEPISQAEYASLMANIDDGMKEDIGFEHVDCASGACPVDFAAE